MDAPAQLGVPRKGHDILNGHVAHSMKLPHQTPPALQVTCSTVQHPRDGDAGFHGDVSQLCWYSLQKGEKLPQCSAWTHTQMYTLTHKHACTCVYTHACTLTRTDMHVCVCSHMHTLMCTCVYTCAHMHAHAHRCMHSHVHACTHTHSLAHMYTFTCTLTHGHVHIYVQKHARTLYS